MKYALEICDEIIRQKYKINIFQDGSNYAITNFPVSEIKGGVVDLAQLLEHIRAEYRKIRIENVDLKERIYELEKNEASKKN